MTAVILPFPDINPWEREPNQVSTFFGNYHLYLFRHPHLLNLNGYVGIPPKHPYYGVGAWEDRIQSLHVHGGVTFAGVGGRLPGMQAGLWYFGFDTAHYGDYSPGLMRDLDMVHKKMGIPRTSSEMSLFGNTECYRNVAYVQAEVELLFEQLRKVQRDVNLKKYIKRMKRRMKS